MDPAPADQAEVHFPFTTDASGGGTTVGGGAVRRPDPATEPAEAWLPLLDDRSPNAWVCPFLRAADDDDTLGVPIEAPDPANRCAAMRDAVPQSLRQQELVCLTSGHINCPRYLRGAVVMTDVPNPVVRRGPIAPPAILVSIVLLFLAFTGSVAFVLARGGIELDSALIASPGPAASATAVAAAPPASAAPSVAASPVAVSPVASVAVELGREPAAQPDADARADSHPIADPDTDTRTDRDARRRPRSPRRNRRPSRRVASRS